MYVCYCDACTEARRVRREATGKEGSRDVMIAAPKMEVVGALFLPRWPVRGDAAAWAFPVTQIQHHRGPRRMTGHGGAWRGVVGVEAEEDGIGVKRRFFSSSLSYLGI